MTTPCVKKRRIRRKTKSSFRLTNTQRVRVDGSTPFLETDRSPDEKSVQTLDHTDPLYRLWRDEYKIGQTKVKEIHARYIKDKHLF